MTTLTLVLFLVLLPLCLFLIGLILLQGGAGDISSAFGGGGQLDSTLGVGAGRKMSKITGWLSGLFMAIVLVLSVQHTGDFGKAAGGKTAPLPVEKKEGAATPATLPLPPGVTLPAHPVDPAVAPAPEVPAGKTAPVAPAAAPAAAVPAAPTAPVIEQPAAPAVPAPVVPQAPVPAAPAVVVPPAVAPAAPVAVPAAPAPAPAATETPAAPRSGITLDEPKK